jgi:exodeoxyribonuclease VIII
MTMEQYRAVDAVNFSWLKQGLPGVGYMIYRRDWTGDSASMLKGRAIHCLLLEPDQYGERYTTAPKIDRRTKEGKADWAAYVEQAKGKEVLTDDEAREVGAMAAAIERNTRAMALLKSKGERELACIWRDEPTGLMMKCRMDLVVPGTVGVLADIKTTQAADYESFSRSIQKYAYDVQSAMYTDAYAAITKRRLEHAIIAVDEAGCFVYTMGEASIHAGRCKYRRVLHDYARVKVGEMPEWDDSVRVIEMPEWELKKYASEGGIQ